MPDSKIISETQLDILKEISTISAGNAATGLSVMLNKRIDLSISDIYMAPVEEIADILKAGEQPVVAVYIQLRGQFAGSILFICEIEKALILTDILTGKDLGSSLFLDEASQSALKELTNIISGCYVKALSEITDMKIMYYPPIYAADMFAAIIDGILIKIGSEVEHAVVTDTQFQVEKKLIKSYLLLIPEVKGLKTILERLENN